MVNSAGMQVAPVDGEPGGLAANPVTVQSIVFSRSTAYAGLALVALAIAARLPVRRGARSSPATAMTSSPGRSPN